MLDLPTRLSWVWGTSGCWAGGWLSACQVRETTQCRAGDGNYTNLSNSGSGNIGVFSSWKCDLCHSLGWIRIHHLCWASLSGSHICNVWKCWLISKSFHLIFLPSPLSLSLSSTQIHFTVAIDFTASNGKDCFFFSVDWICSLCCWPTDQNQILP